uniref:Uncharacterized protein n=1 Tax=Anopheles melas TaxID=34690 RepID=A0A182UAA9_9DIPT
MKFLLLALSVFMLVTASTAQSSKPAAVVQMQMTVGKLLMLVRELSVANNAFAKDTEDQTALNTLYITSEDLYRLLPVFGTSRTSTLPLVTRERVNRVIANFKDALTNWETAMDERSAPNLLSTFKAVENAFLSLGGVVFSLASARGSPTAAPALTNRRYGDLARPSLSTAKDSSSSRKSSPPSFRSEDGSAEPGASLAAPLAIPPPSPAAGGSELPKAVSGWYVSAMVLPSPPDSSSVSPSSGSQWTSLPTIRCSPQYLLMRKSETKRDEGIANGERTVGAMKLLLALLLLLTVIKYSGSIKIACDYDYTCTIEQLSTSQQLHDLPNYSFGDAGMIKLIDSLVPPEAISSFQPIVNYLILERWCAGQLILPPNCTLQCLSLMHTSIHRLEVFHSTQLYYLSVANSEISSLLPSLYNLTALETVRLWQMHIPVFSFDVLRNMEKLNGIELSYNRIERLQLSSTLRRDLLPESDPARSFLQSLVHDRLCTVEQHASVDDTAAFIQRDSRTVQIAPNLTELDLSNNRIKSIDLCRWQIGSLKGLNVVNNRIEHLFDCLGELQNLQTFQIADNALTQLDLAAFTQL